MKFHLVGKNLEKKDIDQASLYIEEERKRYSVDNIKGECEKSPDDILSIELVSKFLKEELSRFKVDIDGVSLNQVHFFSHDNFIKFFPGIQTKAFYMNLENAICIDVDLINNKLELLRVILHESIHSCSFNKFCLDKDKKEIGVYRSGYGNVSRSGEVHEHFYGLNEAITEKIVLDIVQKNQDVIKKELNISQSEFDNEVEAELDYHGFIEILDIIIEKISKGEGLKKDEIWEKFINGYFTGEMMHLRDVEKYCGNGSLRFLAALTSNMKDLPHEKLINDVKRFFQSENDDEKSQIAQDVLKEL